MAVGDVNFRSKVETTTTAPVTADNGPRIASQSKIEVPFTDYSKENNHPFAVDYYQLGDTWEDPDGGFYKEVSIIDGYMKNLIDKGEINNSVDAVKAKIKSIEKLNNITKEQRTSYKVSATAAYIKFLQETDSIKNNISKYGHT